MHGPADACDNLHNLTVLAHVYSQVLASYNVFDAALNTSMHAHVTSTQPHPLLPCCHQQGVMLDIVAMILIVIEDNLPFGLMWTPWSDLFYALSFWFIFLLVIYCLFFCFM